MAQIVDFNPTNGWIVERSVAGDSVLSWQEIYSEWKDWVLDDPLVRGAYEPAFRVLGGEERGGGAPRLGTTYFLLPPWKFKPAEYSHHVTIEGNIVTDPPGGRIWVPTTGAYTVGVQLESSNLVDTVAIGSGVLPSDITTIVGGVRDAILSDGTPFPGANIDARVSEAGGGLTEAQALILTQIQTRVAELWQLKGLDVSNPLVVSYQSVVSGFLELVLTRASGTTTVARAVAP